MSRLPEHLTPEAWLTQIFASSSARRGGIVKRQVRDVERLVGREAFLREIERRGFQVLENGGHFVIFCNALPIHRPTSQGLSKALEQAASKRLDGMAGETRFRNRVGKAFRNALLALAGRAF